ncbi:MAG TPA: hypothetical protein VF796_08850 [Humisphaera sp.]
MHLPIPRRTFLALCAAAASALTTLPARAAEPEQPDRPRFVVHEWGVMVTGKTADGAAELGPPAELTAQLPPFVLRHASAFKPKRQDHGWDKPVLHFYGPAGTAVRVKVGTPAGVPLAYWPPPAKFDEQWGKAITDRRAMMIYQLTEARGMEWAGTLSAEPAKPPAAAAAGHWWGGLRDVPGMWFNAAGGSERFVFYEATARKEPVVRSTLSTDVLTLANTGRTDSGPVVVIVNDGTARRVVTVPNVPAGGKVELPKKDLPAQPTPDDATLAAAAAQWRAFGMTSQEADAIARCWRPDLLNTPGVLVAARMPADVYAAMFPLTVEPKPDEVVRAGVVFDVLPGQDARLDWLPGIRATLDGWAKDLLAADFPTREAAARRFVRTGDLVRPYLQELAKSPNVELSRQGQTLLRAMTPAPTTKPADVLLLRPGQLRER